MQYQALYRKYRPRLFLDIIGQDNIVRVLKNSIINNKMGHAYLFSGPRGTGKTSTAKIFASTINCINIQEGEKCGKCSSCIDDNNVDIIEIDAASNNGVDEIREIRNNSKLLPANSKFKIYIIDEVHMLSIGAFNALLKTLEEPPKHVIFILATTELQKVPLTIISRCQKFQFKKLTVDNIREKLEEIIKKEKIDIDSEAVTLISELSDGGLRDAINILDQATSIIDDKIDVKKVADMSGIVMEKEIEEFTNYLLNFDSKSSLDFIEYLTTEGKSYILFCERLILHLRNKMIDSILNNKKIQFDKYIKFIYAFIDLQNNLKKSLNQKVLFEIKILELLNLDEKMLQKIEKEKLSTEVKNKEICDNKTSKEKYEARKTSNQINNKITPEQDFDYYIDVNKIRINNVLATADKQKLLEYKEKYKLISEYLSNNTYNDISIILTNSNLTVASEDYILITLQDYLSKNFLLNNLTKVEELINKIFEKKLKPCFLANEEWIKVKEEYKENIKKNIKYSVEKEPELKEKLKKNMTSLEETALDIFGEDNIELN